MQEDFKVSITGDISGLKKAVGDAEKELSSFALKSRELKQAIAENIAISRGYDQAINELKKSFRSGAISQTQFKEALVRLKRDEKETAIETTKLKNELIDLNRAGAGLAKSTPQIGAGLKTVDKTGANATNTMMEFSRVVQDAPYGIRGVANNIQQLVGNFGYLSKSAGGAGNAMKAMVSSLMGPAGILLAVSLVTSLLVQYGDQLASIGSKSSKLAKKNEELAKSFETSNSVLEAEIGALDAQLEIMKLQKVSTKELIALKLKLLEQSHLALVNQQFELEAQLKNTKAVALEHSLMQKIINLSLKMRGLPPLPALIDNEEKEKLKEIEIGIANTKQRIQETILAIGKITAPDVFDPEKIKKEAEKLKPIRLPATLDIKFEGQRGLNETEQLLKDAFGRPIPTDQFKLLDNLPIHVGETNSQITRLMGELQKVVPSDLFGSLVGLSLQQLQQLDNKLQTTQVVADVFNNAVGSGFQALGNQIATSLETGNAILDALVSSLISSLTSIATALITQAITEKLIASQVIATNLAKSNANGITIATSAAAALGPAGIVALPGLIASQLAIINGAFAGIAAVGAFAGGGIVPGGSFNGDKVPAFVNSGEMILNSGQQSNLFDILDGNLRKLGGQQQMQTINVQGELRGQTILLANKRAEKNTNRFYGRK